MSESGEITPNVSFFLAAKIGDFSRTAKGKTYFNLEKSAPVTLHRGRCALASILRKFIFPSRLPQPLLSHQQKVL